MLESSQAEASPKSILVPPTEVLRPQTETTIVKKPPTATESELETPPVEPQTKTTDVELQTETAEIEPAPAPISPDEVPAPLDVEAGDEAEIETRPGSENPCQLDLNGSNDQE